MTTKATPEDARMKVGADIVRQIRTTAGNHAALGHTRQAAYWYEWAEYLESLLCVLRADGRGLPRQRELFATD